MSPFGHNKKRLEGAFDKIGEENEFHYSRKSFIHLEIYKSFISFSSKITPWLLYYNLALLPLLDYSSV